MYKKLMLTGLLLTGGSMGYLAAQDQKMDAFSREPVNDEGKVREIIFNSDDDQDFMTTKVYKLNYLLACDLTPYLKGAVKRYGAGNVERLSHDKGKEQYVSVTTARKLIPYIDDLVATLDKPFTPSTYACAYSGYDPAKENRPTIVDGDGMFKEVYWPKFRHSASMLSAIIGVGAVSGDGRAFYDPDHGFFLLKDSKSDAARTLQLWDYLDRPLAQAELVFNIYEVSDQDATELGMDWVSWKNGPANGLPLFGTGLSGMQSWASGIEKAYKSSNWMFGGIFFAPQFDASFLRLLNNKAKIRSVTAARAIITNGHNASIQFDPAFQNISKDEEMRIGVVQGAKQGIRLDITSPVLCYDGHSEKDALLAENIIFNYNLKTQSVAGRTHLGTESVNQTSSVGALTLQTDVEKVLSVYTTERDVSENIGWPVLGDIPGLKYIFSSETHVKATTRYYVTVTATAVVIEQNMNDFADSVIQNTKPRPPHIPDSTPSDDDTAEDALIPIDINKDVDVNFAKPNQGA